MVLLTCIILKEFAFELGPVISDIYNASLREAFIPSLLISVNVRPLPKQIPACSVQDDVRAISPADLPGSQSIRGSYFSENFAVVYLLHLALEALDKGNCYVRFFFTDFSEGFDIIDHHILLDKLGNYVLPECLVRWVAAFLMARAQRVCLDSSLSSTKMLNGQVGFHFICCHGGRSVEILGSQG